MVLLTLAASARRRRLREWSFCNAWCGLSRSYWLRAYQFSRGLRECGEVVVVVVGDGRDGVASATCRIQGASTPSAARPKGTLVPTGAVVQGLAFVEGLAGSLARRRRRRLR